jgi:hypothetical protein
MCDYTAAILMFLRKITGHGLNFGSLKDDLRLRAHVYLTGADIEVCSQSALGSLEVMSRNTRVTWVDALGQHLVPPRLSLHWFTGDSLICFKVSVGREGSCCVCRSEAADRHSSVLCAPPVLEEYHFVQQSITR